MPRKPRMYMAGLPCHVIQRGNNRESCFFSEQDYLFYLECLKDGCSRYKVALHAYVLMTNHVHLLMTPDDTEGVSRVLQSLGRRYVQYVNKLYRRSGTLWEGRHKASIVDADNYLLTCMRYIELNPVRAGMVEHPGEYPWSSYGANAQGDERPMVESHEVYLGLAMHQRERMRRYRSLFEVQLEECDIHAIRKATEYAVPLGSERFVQQIEKVLGRSVGKAKRGRPAVREDKEKYCC